jgi:hypothetical protein
MTWWCDRRDTEYDSHVGVLEDHFFQDDALLLIRPISCSQAAEQHAHELRLPVVLVVVVLVVVVVCALAVLGRLTTTTTTTTTTTCTAGLLHSPPHQRRLRPETRAHLCQRVAVDRLLKQPIEHDWSEREEDLLSSSVDLLLLLLVLVLVLVVIVVEMVVVGRLIIIIIEEGKAGVVALARKEPPPHVLEPFLLLLHTALSLFQ